MFGQSMVYCSMEKNGEGISPPFSILVSCTGTPPACAAGALIYAGGGGGRYLWEVLRVNVKRLMYKLQTALCMRGEKIKINQRQSWSEKNERMVTKYVIQKEVFDKKQQRMKYETILESYQAADVVKHLAALLDDGGGGG